MKTNATNFDRRSFLKGGALLSGAAALAAFGVTNEAHAAYFGEALASTGNGSVPENWDYEADIIAIGAGGAGLSCAIEAKEQGVSCIVIESQSIPGGNSALCNGGIAIPGSPLQEEQGIDDNPDIMFEDLCAWFGTDYDEGYVRLLCDLNGGDLYDWLTGLGLEFLDSGLLQSNGHSRPREHHITPGTVIDTLAAAAEADTNQIHYNTTATALLRHPETGRMMGVMAETADDTVLYKANKAVLLCTGGYGHNQDLLAEWNFGPAAYDMTVFNGSLGQQGQGLMMAMSIGAQPRHLSYCGMLTVQHPEGSLGQACAMYHQGAVMVNLEGNRFVNEAQGYTNVWSELLAQPENVCYQIWDQQIADKCAENESGYYSQSKVEATGFLLTADTFEDLAAQMEIPVDAFVATMEQYNSDVDATGADSVFGREHISGTGDAPFALNQPPYYAFKTTSLVSSTYGGLKRWEGDHLQACDWNNDPIEGLYLAGNISDFCNMGIVPGTRRPINASGCSFGGAMSFGRYCCQEMAKLADWDSEEAAAAYEEAKAAREAAAAEARAAAPAEEEGVQCVTCHNDERKPGDENPHGY